MVYKVKDPGNVIFTGVLLFTFSVEYWDDYNKQQLITYEYK